MKRHYEIISYDVWGNNEDGYEVNNKFTTGITLEIEETESNEKIIKMLKDLNYLNKLIKFVVSDQSDENNIYIDLASDYRPICELREVTNS